jgi:hypothetical protein
MRVVASHKCVVTVFSACECRQRKRRHTLQFSFRFPSPDVLYQKVPVITWQADVAHDDVGWLHLTSLARRRGGLRHLHVCATILD